MRGVEALGASGRLEPEPGGGPRSEPSIRGAGIAHWWHMLACPSSSRSLSVGLSLSLSFDLYLCSLSLHLSLSLSLCLLYPSPSLFSSLPPWSSLSLCLSVDTHTHTHTHTHVRSSLQVTSQDYTYTDSVHGDDTTPSKHPRNVV